MEEVVSVVLQVKVAPETPETVNVELPQLLVTLGAGAAGLVMVKCNTAAESQLTAFVV